MQIRVHQLTEGATFKTTLTNRVGTLVTIMADPFLPEQKQYLVRFEDGEEKGLHPNVIVAVA
jgi:hypothetical protein